MGYEVHVTRKKFWADEEDVSITALEWLAYVASDPWLRLDPHCKRHSVAILSERFPNAGPCLYWFEGNISTKNPNEEILAKLLMIASALGARVQGDDGEIYRTASLEDFYREDDA